MDPTKGDILLAVFMMHETLKGDKSFYAPFLRILPEPSNISEWTDSQLNLLQVLSCRLCAPYSLHKIVLLSGYYAISTGKEQTQPIDSAYDT